MPNHVKNRLKAEGLSRLPIFGRNEDGEEIFDFNTLIPMPETLEIEAGSVEDIAIEAVLRKIDKKQRFSIREQAHSMTDSVFWDIVSHSRFSLPELEKQGMAYIQNIVLHGSATWYDWRVEHCGTKWNAYSFERVDDDTIMFETAWSAPHPVIDELAHRYPMMVFEHWWADEDAGQNTGYKEYLSDGTTIEGYFNSGSNEAFENYFSLWGESECFEKIDGCWHHKDCDICGGC